MRIATLQFSPRLGDVQGNIQRANELLKLEESCTDAGPGIEELRPEMLVLPEMAFTGYNFPSLEAITPYLEPMGKGPTAKWAKDTAIRLKCNVCVGYPEIQEAEASEEAPSSKKIHATDKCYNSLLVVGCSGEILLNYRKRFLYYTDETWAEEGDLGWGFHSLGFVTSDSQSIEERVKHVPTSFGICMDINPYRFEAPSTAWEFSNQVMDSGSQLVIVSMAWNLPPNPYPSWDGRRPDLDTFNYWIRRFWPLLQRRMEHVGDVDGSLENETEKKIVIVFANRAGEEQGRERNSSVRYSGTSSIIAITQHYRRSNNHKVPEENATINTHEVLEDFDVSILCWDMKNAEEESICFADTLTEPKLVFAVSGTANNESEMAD